MEAQFRSLLNTHFTVSYEDQLAWFLGMKFDWSITSTGIKVHVHQEAFISKLLSRHQLSDCNRSPRATPFKSGFPVDTIPPSTLSSTAQSKITPPYQQLMGVLTWLSISTRPDITAILSLLSEHTHTPAPAHLQYALHVVKDQAFTKSLGLLFSSDTQDSLKAFVQFKDANTGLNILCDANWGPMDTSKPKPTTPPVEQITTITPFNFRIVISSFWCPYCMGLSSPQAYSSK